VVSGAGAVAACVGADGSVGCDIEALVLGSAVVVDAVSVLVERAVLREDFALGAAVVSTSFTLLAGLAVGLGVGDSGAGVVFVDSALACVSLAAGVAAILVSAVLGVAAATFVLGAGFATISFLPTTWSK